MLAANSSVGAPETPPEPPPRIARKVIIRHISHAAAPPPLGILRAGPSAIPSIESELPPETIINEPAPTAPTNPLPSVPQIAPLNVAFDNISPIQVRGAWDHDAALAPMVLVSNVKPQDAPSTLVNVQLDALATAEEAANAWNLRRPDALASDPAAMPFAAKSLDDCEEPRIQIRFDSPHAHSRQRPHAKFGMTQEEKAAASDSPAVPEIQPEPELHITEDLDFAESPDEPLASDLIPPGDEITNKVSEESSPKPASAAKPAVPLWEVDRFHWPRTCEKLFADEHGYLSRAGEKLLAAMQDGLKVLAITGSRRGEGRTTLALCLARAAAQAGIQVAVMDADFARPQLASKVALEITYGWQDAALGQIPLSEAAVKSLADNITLLPLEPSTAARSLSLADPRVTATIRAAAATFELLILDLGPLTSSDRVAFPPDEKCPFDAAIVVRDLRFATASESERLGHTLHDAGVEAVGIAENFVIEDEIPATSV
jgi:Mrp family chromosome partitioning ATPase